MEGFAFIVTVWFIAFVARFGWDAAGWIKSDIAALFTAAMNRLEKSARAKEGREDGR